MTGLATGTMIVPALITFVAAAILTGLLRRYALANNMMDEVNARSSHTVPTPRGGGMSIVLSTLAGFAWFAWSGELPLNSAIALGFGGMIVAAMGWFDDHGHVPAPIRLIAHFSAAILLVVFVDPFPLGWIWLDWFLIEWLVTVVMIVWLINLFNFMDGIDGIAASEAITVSLGTAVLAAMADNAGLVFASLLLAGASAGFLVWNWQPAKIFMGDACSGFVGFILAGFAVIAAQGTISGFEAAPGVAVMILLAVFASDATVTVIRRAFRREPIFEAHRSHAYQSLARRVGNHWPVTLGCVAINLIVLLPLALLVARGTLAPLIGAGVAYAALVLLVFLLGAGAQERTP